MAEAIASIVGITGVSEAEARILLRKYNNNADASINAWLDDPVGSLKEQPISTGWDFTQDNIGPYADDSSVGGMPATRPPSRADNARPIVDLSAEHAAAAATRSQTLKEQEDDQDADLQRAMAESMVQTLPAQENGVTGAGTHFGPATRDHYDAASWAMTTFASSREIVDHPPPSKRRRLNDQPAFLRGSKETEYLGSLLTIYHNIPLARQALLMPSLKVLTYGHDPSWWSGTTDENTKALSTDTSVRIDRDSCNLLTEIQCLMAFLDQTQRAYGSVEALSELYAYRNFDADTPFVRFLQSWRWAAVRQNDSEPLTQVFSSVAVKETGAVVEPRIERSLMCVETPMSRSSGQTLVNLLDNTVWNDNSENVDDVWIDQCADIFTVRVYDPNNSKDGIDLTVEPVWYPDRYMNECKEESLAMRKEMQKIRREIDHYTSIQRRCDSMRTPDGRTIKIRDTLDAASKAIPAVGKKSELEMQRVQAELQKVLGQIEQKIARLDERKRELREQIRKIALRLTKPTPEDPDKPSRKYMLQGMSTRPEITYVRRLNRDLLDLDAEDEQLEHSEWQWWRMEWHQHPTSDKPGPSTIGPVTQAQAEATKRAESHLGEDSDQFSVRKVTEREVVEAVKREHSSVVLVYANEHAMEPRQFELSRALRHFVECDNQAFAEELQREEGVSLELSVDAEAGIEFEDVPLLDVTGSSSSTRELTPMSASSPSREENGQASPIRAKGNDALDSGEHPPSYEETVDKREMQERKGNKIGLASEKLMEKYGGGGAEDDLDRNGTGGDYMHVEHTI